MLQENKQGNIKSDTQQKSNIWQDILQNSMIQKDLEESHIFVFGDKYVGKRSLIKIINKELLQKGEVEGILII